MEVSFQLTKGPCGAGLLAVAAVCSQSAALPLARCHGLRGSEGQRSEGSGPLWGFRGGGFGGHWREDMRNCSTRKMPSTESVWQSLSPAAHSKAQADEEHLQVAANRATRSRRGGRSARPLPRHFHRECPPKQTGRSCPTKIKRRLHFGSPGQPQRANGVKHPVVIWGPVDPVELRLEDVLEAMPAADCLRLCEEHQAA